ncbi:uncharacterized protein LOC134840375 [Symsagittifera roscoffensis]|uniref:uncharacterized protein LOC134840375 n=1 Tax=Symsagittifera roscoffensis TaxID=84072 RepID=UPI00307C64F5
MVKVWDVNTCEEIRTLLGHSGTVTAVKIIYPLIKTDADHANNKAELQNFIGRLNKDAGSEVARGEDGLCLTASTDCCIKLWNYSSGLILRSVYTFSSVTSIHLMASSLGREGRLAVISGNESGKLQIWDPNDGQELLSKKCHDDSIDHIWPQMKLLSPDRKTV